MNSGTSIPVKAALANPLGIAFVGSEMDRSDHVRANPALLAAAMTPGARLLRLDGLDPRISADGHLEWGSLADAGEGAELVYLGRQDGRDCFAPVPAAGSVAPANPRLWQAMAALSGEELATYGCARAIVDWHARHRFCARCGSGSVPAKGGWQRNCTNEHCGAEHFPRVDPVTIMLVQYRDSLLLGRQPRFPAGNYSALAGFVEPGESIEEAVAREVQEEAGIVVRDVTYIASQPWPFPSSLMIGCHAWADDPDVTVDTTELEDARWFSRAEIEDAVESIERGEQGRAFGAPPRTAVANALLRWWLRRG
jgi:NAD+ diphosphatase